MAQRVLVVDDEANILELCRLYLEREGYEVLEARDGEAALDRARSESPDLVVLDVMLPKLDGFEVCRRLRAESNLPILMLTARDEDVDKIVGLELGADDYLTKPFNPRELVARVKAILRRQERARAADEAPSSVVVGDVRIEPARHQVEIGGRRVDLRPKEFELLKTLARNPGFVLSRDRLLELVWGYDYAGETRTVDVHVAKLRKHLQSSDSVRIETVTGVGYKLVERES